MMPKYGKLFEQVTFSNGVKAKNRFMLAPMCDDSAERRLLQLFNLIMEGELK